MSRPITNNPSIRILGYAVGFFVFLIWGIIQYPLVLGENVSWLLIAAQRLVDGQSMASHIFETNPPLSIILYTPFIILSNFTSLSTHQSVFALTIASVFFSIWASWIMLCKLQILSETQKLSFILANIVVLTSLTNIYLGEREHIITVLIMPFFLAQMAIARRIAIPKPLLFTVLILGSIAFLIKPHYGILPTLMLIHRMIMQKRLSVVFDIDFIILSITTLLYVGLIAVFFQDYATVIFPDVINLYITIGDTSVFHLMVAPFFLACISLIIVEMVLDDIEPEKKRFLMALYIASLICFIPVFVQMKGFFNHLFPAFAFMFCALCLTFTLRAERYIKPKYIKAGLIGLFLFCLYSPYSSLENYPKIQTVGSMPVGKYVAKTCMQPCTFFMFHDSLAVTNVTSVYTKWTHGTRFPAYWFISQIAGSEILQNQGIPSYLSVEEVKRLKTKYGDFIAQDFDFYKPSVVLLAKDIEIVAGNKFDLVSFLGDNRNFREKFLNQYTKTEEFVFDEAVYFAGTSMDFPMVKHYDVYKRNDAL